jgi:hypothetical protein
MDEELVRKIREVLVTGCEGGRVDFGTRRDFEHMVDRGLDLTKVGAGFLVEVGPGVEVPGDVGGVSEDFRCAMLTYAGLLEVLNTEGVRRVELSGGSRHIEWDGDLLLGENGELLGLLRSS